jgi:hypothetical protein
MWRLSKYDRDRNEMFIFVGMKISYKNYPILEKLHKGSLGIIPILESDKLFFDLYSDTFFKNWKFYNDKFKQEINIISEPFYNASKEAQDKLFDLYSNIITNDLSDFETIGTFIVDKLVHMIYYSTKKGSEDQELIYYLFDNKGTPLCMYIDSAQFNIHQNCFVSTFFKGEFNKNEVLTFVYANIFNINTFNMFKMYAQVETKIIKGNTKSKIDNQKYFNDTKLDVTYLDSKWFTSIVKSDGFKVRGHFRLQPKKHKGEWTKELIWISDFEKKGYTSIAKILNH